MNNSKWTVSTLGNVCSKIFSGGTPTTTTESFWNGEHHWLSSGETRNDFIIATEKTITDEGVAKSSTRLALKGDIVIASAGQGKTRGQTSFLMINSYINQSVIALRANTFVYNLYLYYYLKSQYDELRNSSDASSIRGSITTKDLATYVIKYPEYRTQEKIATILFKYDCLIENNNRRIAILEEMAQRLYREWFIHFRFPGHENVKMVESEMGSIPQGWEISNIENLTNMVRRGITPKYDETANLTVVNQKCIRDFSLDMTLSRKQSKPYAHEINIAYADILINSTGAGTLGRVAQNFFSFKDTTIDSHITLVRPIADMQCYIGAILKSKQQELMDLGTGSTNQTELSREIIKKIKVLIPSSDLSQAFEKTVKSWMDLKATLTTKNINLRKTRDLLLPRLISGDIDVSELDIVIERNVEDE